MSNPRPVPGAAARRRPHGRPDRRAVLALGLGALAALSGCHRRPRRGEPVAAGASVLALGDSLTHGTGATPETAYPAVLARLTGWQVVNAGVPGDTTAQARARLPALLADHHPRLVIVSLGGNDFLRRLPEAQTRTHLGAACDEARAAGAQVLLLAVPRPSLTAVVGVLDDHPLYAEIAATRNLPLVAGGWSAVLSDAELRADAIHANARGYAEMARRVAAAARETGLLAG